MIFVIDSGIAGDIGGLACLKKYVNVDIGLAFKSGLYSREGNSVSHFSMLEIRLIIKILKNPCYPINID